MQIQPFLPRRLGVKGGMPKTTKKWRKSLKNPQKKQFWCAHTVKIVGNFVQSKFCGILGQKVLIKTIFWDFWDFCAIFWSFLTYLLWRPISVVRTAEFAIFRLNVVILVIIQWNKPEKGRVRKSVPEKCKSSQTFTLKKKRKMYHFKSKPFLPFYLMK